MARAEAWRAECGAPWGAVRGRPGKGRIALDRELLAAQDGITIRYTGWQLTQSDLDVWSRPCTWPVRRPSGRAAGFTEKGFLKALGRQSGKSGRDWLRSALARLTATAFEISDGHRTYGGGLMDFYRDEDTGRTVLEINPKLAPFFGRSQWTQIDWEQRQRLRGKPLALWLHGFYATHAAPHALTVEYLHKLSGSQTKRLRKFKENLTQALRDLEAAGTIQGFYGFRVTWFMSRPCRVRASSATWPRRGGGQVADGDRGHPRGA